MRSDATVKRVLRPARDLAQRLLTETWCVLFRLTRARDRSRTAARWVSRGADRVLVLAPHPDDEVCGPGGTLCLHRRAGDRVALVVVTDGRRSTALGLRPEVMACRRRHEAKAAADALAIEDWRWWGLPEGDWQPSDMALRLEEVMQQLQPRIVYAPSRVDFHPEHHRVAQALAGVLDRSVTSVQEVRVYELSVPLGPTLVNLVADVSAVADEVERAAAAHTSQLGAIAPALRAKRYAAAMHGASGQAESFLCLEPAEYARMHRGAADGWARGWRGLRYFAASDPLAYVCGRARRRALRGMLGWPMRQSLAVDAEGSR